MRYLKYLKGRFETQTVNNDEKWEVVRLAILVSFLLKDKENSLISQGLNFRVDKNSSLKPSFIKGLMNILNFTLEKLDYFDDESIFEAIDSNQKSSFVQSNAKVIKMRRSMVSDKFMESVGNPSNNELEELSPFHPSDSRNQHNLEYCGYEQDSKDLGDVYQPSIAEDINSKFFNSKL